MPLKIKLIKQDNAGHLLYKQNKNKNTHTHIHTKKKTKKENEMKLLVPTLLPFNVWLLLNSCS